MLVARFPEFDRSHGGMWVKLDAPVWASVSEAAKDLIRCLMNVDPNARFSVQQVRVGTRGVCMGGGGLIDWLTDWLTIFRTPTHLHLHTHTGAATPMGDGPPLPRAPGTRHPRLGRRRADAGHGPAGRRGRAAAAAAAAAASATGGAAASGTTASDGAAAPAGTGVRGGPEHVERLGGLLGRDRRRRQGGRERGGGGSGHDAGDGDLQAHLDGRPGKRRDGAADEHHLLLLNRLLLLGRPTGPPSPCPCPLPPHLLLQPLVPPGPRARDGDDSHHGPQQQPNTPFSRGRGTWKGSRVHPPPSHTHNPTPHRSARRCRWTRASPSCAHRSRRRHQGKPARALEQRG